MGSGEFMGGPEPLFAFDANLGTTENPVEEDQPKEQPKPVDTAINPVGYTPAVSRPDNDHRAFDPHSRTFDF